MLKSRQSQAEIDVREGLRSLHDHCLGDLVAGLQAMERGDNTVVVTPATTPIDPGGARGDDAELVELFNGMLGEAQQALESYNAVRERQRAALGDHSCLDQLESRLTQPQQPLPRGSGRGPGGDDPR